MANNPVQKPLYLVFCAIDFVITFIYALILVQRVHFGNFQITKIAQKESSHNTTLMQIYYQELDILGNSNQTSEYNEPGIQLTFIRLVDFSLIRLIQEQGNKLFYFTIVILGFCFFIMSAILIMSLLIKNHADLEKQSFLKKCFTFILVAIQGFLHMPIFDIIVRTVVSTFENTYSIEIVIIRYIICAVTSIAFGIIMLYLIRIFNISVPSELVPWCAPISKLAFLNILIKGLMVVFCTFDIQGKYALIQVIILFVLQAFQASYRVLFAPNYLKEVDIFIKSKDFAICLIFFISIICKILGDRSNYDLVYFIIFIPVVTYGWMIFESHRKQSILIKVKTRAVKLEIEYEYALYVMMTLVRDCMTESLDSQKNFGQLMDLVITHVEDCDDQLCICDEMENFYELLRLKYLHNQDVFPLLRSERKKYRKIIDDQGLIGTVSNITDLTLKQNSSESTMMKTQGANNEGGSGNNEKLERNAEGDEEEEDDGKKMFQKKQQQKNKKSKRQVYKINIDETKHRFLSELLYLFYFEIIRKYPDSYKIQLLSNYFSLQFKRKEMLCIFQMRSFIKQKLSKLDQYCHSINEQYLLWEINKVHKSNLHSSQNQQDGNFNGEYFIRMNQLYKQFNLCIESLSSNVVGFWRVFERPQIDVEITYHKGTNIARDIQQTFKVFNELDMLKIFKDYQMYFQFAIVQLHILNDPVAYELYIGKMKSILEINKVYQKNFSQNDDSKNTDLINFIIVDANGLKFGQIIQCNNNLRMLLGWSEDEISRNRIESFMPTLIRQKHPEFMNRYNKTGQSFIINNKVTVFIKKANGYVIPVELYIKFHYSIDYQYTFLAIIKPFYEMTPFANGVKYNIEQLLFLIVDNEDSGGRIIEFSESSVGMLGNYGFNGEVERNGITKHISDVVMDIDFNQIRKTRQDRYVTNKIYESVHSLDLNQFSDSHQNPSFQMLYHQASQTGGGGDSFKHLQNSGLIQAKTRIFEERYSGGVLDMNIFCFAFIYDNEYMTTGSYPPGSTIQSRGAKDSKISKNSKAAKKTEGAAMEIKEENQEMLDVIMERENESQSASYSSNGSSTTSMAEFRNFHSFSEQSTPKTLQLVIKMIFALYLIMVTIASVNLGINITRQLQSERDVQTVRQSFARMNSVSMNQLLVRVLLNIANGYEPQNSTLINNRFQSYQDLQEKKIQELKDTQSSLQQSSFETSSDFDTFITGKNVPLYYINEKNEAYVQYESLNVAFNLYIAKLTEINSYTERDLVGNLQIQTLLPKEAGKYKPTQMEQTLFFIVQNGNRELRQFSIDASQYYSRESEDHAEQNILSTKLTAIVSIIVIVVIGLIIAPILTQAEIRKYKALLYFLKIPKDQFPILLKNCEYCLDMSDEKRYLQIMKDYESFLGIKLVNQQVDQLRTAKSRQNNLDNQNSGHGGFSSSGMRSSDYFTQSSGRMGSVAQSKNSRINTGKAGGGDQDDNSNKMIDIEGSAMESVASVNSRPQPSELKRSGNENNGDQMTEQQRDDQDDQALDQRDEVVNRNKFNLKTLNLKQNRNIEKKQHVAAAASKKKNEGGDEDNEEDEKEEASKEEHSQISQKVRMINAQAYKRRSTMIFSSLTLILILSTYFLIAYFLAIRTFDTAAVVIHSLESIFYKGSCFDSAMNFLRESEIRNESMLIKTGFKTDAGYTVQREVVATDYYIDFCFSKESDYGQMRVDLPPYFQGMSSYFADIESGKFCRAIYTNGSLLTQCERGLDGILEKGLTNAFFHMFNQIMKANLEFNSLGAVKGRNESMLRGGLLDETIIQIIDLKAQVLDLALDQLKEKTMESVIKYIQKLLNDFIVAYIVFVSLLTVGLFVMILVGFKVLRKSMWDTNILLKIIPFEMLPKRDRIDIKDFFNS